MLMLMMMILEPRLFSGKMLWPQCVVVVVKRLKVLATCQEYGIQ